MLKIPCFRLICHITPRIGDALPTYPEDHLSKPAFRIDVTLWQSRRSFFGHRADYVAWLQPTHIP